MTVVRPGNLDPRSCRLPGEELTALLPPMWIPVDRSAFSLRGGGELNCGRVGRFGDFPGGAQ